MGKGSLLKGAWVSTVEASRNRASVTVWHTGSLSGPCCRGLSGNRLVDSGKQMAIFRISTKKWNPKEGLKGKFESWKIQKGRLAPGASLMADGHSRDSLVHREKGHTLDPHRRTERKGGAQEKQTHVKTPQPQQEVHKEMEATPKNMIAEKFPQMTGDLEL